MNNSIIEIKNPLELQEAINQMKESLSKLRDIFSKQKNNVERINETQVWSGDAAKIVYRKYLMLNNNYDPITYSIDLYIKYLEKVLEDYRRMDIEISKNIDSATDALDVNS